MISETGIGIKAWLVANMKNGAPSKTLEEIRQKIESFSNGFELPADIKLELIETPFTGRRIKSEVLYTDPCPNDAIIIFIHGGGTIMGSAKASRPFATKLQNATGLKIFSVDYRLAPENPFPAAINDICDSYTFLIQKGFKPRNIFFVGESAGAGLLISSLCTIRDKGLEMPAAGILITPWASVEKTGGSRSSLCDIDPWYNKDSIETTAGDIYSKGFDKQNPLVSPVYADLNNFPPLLIHAASDDMFLDDAKNIYENALKVGVEAEIEVWEGMWHIWHSFAPTLPEANDALNKIKLFIERKSNDVSQVKNH